MNTNKIIPHLYLDDYGSRNGRKSAKASMKRKCRRALRREMKVITDA